MSETIEYNDSVIMDIFKREVGARLGEEGWEHLTEGIGTPDIRNEAQSGCHTMREFMKRFDEMTDERMAKAILTHVRHGLKPSDFSWAKESFAEYNNIDDFIRACRDEEVVKFTRLRDTGETFYGQVINDEVLEFVLHQPGMLAAERRGAQLHITAFPSSMIDYLQATDEREKRYLACHCPFAKESILLEKEEVSKTLCFCSLGHAKIMWEAIFDRELDGDVVESALNGDQLCRYVIYLPQELMDQYV